MALDVELLRTTFAHLEERGPDLMARFYELLFERHPELRPMFGPPPALARQQRALLGALAAVIAHFDDAAWLTETLGHMGARHVGYGVTDAMYGWVADAMLSALAEIAGPAWTPAVAGAWGEALGAIAQLMLAGARNGGTAVAV
jgi:hemoglobin-like flavoprotein